MKIEGSQPELFQSICIESPEKTSEAKKTNEKSLAI